MPSRKFLKEEVLACSKKLASLPDFDFVCIDTGMLLFNFLELNIHFTSLTANFITEDTFVGTGMAEEMTKAARGKYFHLDKTDSASIARITKQNIRRGEQ